MTTPQLLTPRRVNIRLSGTDGLALIGATGQAKLVNAYGGPVLDFSALTKHGVWATADIPLIEDGSGIYHIDLLPSESLPNAQYLMAILYPDGELHSTHRFDVPDGSTPLEFADVIVRTETGTSTPQTPTEPTEGVTQEEVDQTIERHRQQGTAHQQQVVGVAINNEGTTLTITFSDGSTIEGLIPEILRGMTDESVFATKVALNTAINELQSADTQLSTAIDAKADSSDLIREHTERVTTDQTLQTNINDEATTRASADTALGTRIDGKVDTSQLTEETTARTNADTALGTRIDTESTNRASADTALGTRIDNYEPADGSIGSEKLDADTEVKKKAFREAVGSAHIGHGTTLPLAAESNVGDVRIFTQSVASGLSWVDISDPTVRITSANAGDVALYFDARFGWTRVGNIIADVVDQDARDAAEAAQDDVDALVAIKTLTPAANVNWDVGEGFRGFITLNENVILTLSGGADGDFAVLRVTQDSTGGRVLSLGPTIGGSLGQPVLSTGSGDVDLLLFTEIATGWHYIGIINDA